MYVPSISVLHVIGVCEFAYMFLCEGQKPF